MIKKFICLSFLLSIMLGPRPGFAGCDLFEADFSAGVGQEWLLDQADEWSVVGGRLQVNPTSDSFWAIAEHDLNPDGEFIFDVDVTYNSANAVITLYAYSRTSGSTYTVNGHTTDGIAVSVYPLQNKMAFTFWDLGANEWVAGAYQDISPGFTSIGMRVLSDAVVFRLNRTDTALRSSGSLTPLSGLDTIWLAASGVGFQGTFDNLCIASVGSESPDYDNVACVPYFSTASASSRWTGLALVNRNAGSNNVLVEYYGLSGNLISSEKCLIPASGQMSFAAQLPSDSEGWIKVSSTLPLRGLALVGQSNPECMFDIDLKGQLEYRLKLPHLAADAAGWNSYILMCNPNTEKADITLTFYDRNGQASPAVTSNSGIAPNGGLRTNLYSMFSQLFPDLKVEGSMIIESTQPIAAFLLYDSRETTWRAGLSAVPVQ